MKAEIAAGASAPLERGCTPQIDGVCRFRRGGSSRWTATPTSTEAARRGWLFALCESRARTLGNLPANLLGAEAMARYLSDMAAARGLSCRALGDAELRALGCGGILAVNAASGRPAKLVELGYRPGRGCDARRSRWSARA